MKIIKVPLILSLFPGNVNQSCHYAKVEQTRSFRFFYAILNIHVALIRWSLSNLSCRSSRHSFASWNAFLAGRLQIRLSCCHGKGWELARCHWLGPLSKCAVSGQPLCRMFTHGEAFWSGLLCVCMHSLLTVWQELWSQENILTSYIDQLLCPKSTQHKTQHAYQVFSKPKGLDLPNCQLKYMDRMRTLPLA